MAPHPQRLNVTRRSWPLARPFATARGVQTAADTIVAEVSDGDSRGRAEGVPLARFGDTSEAAAAALNALKSAILSGLDRLTLQDALPPGAARNALDCAFWDVDAKRAYRAAADMAGLGAPKPVATACAIGLDTPANVAALAAANRARPWLILKLGGEADAEVVRAARDAAPSTRLMVDADEAWDERRLGEILPVLVDCRVELIEQPLPADADGALAGLRGPIPFCADESCRTLADLDRLDGKYGAVNIGLDKAGGLTEALALAAEAKRRGLRIVVGGAIGTSLGAAPALLAAQFAEIVDLGGPLLLASDRVPGLRFDGGTAHPPDESFWG
jgi:L-alanine-DL-glutamate epimerase-like enolase superfamily enzyme